MKYAIYIIGLVALLFYLRHNARRKRMRRENHYESVRVFNPGSDPFEDRIELHVRKQSHNRLSRECAKLDPDFEKALAEEGMGDELSEKPEY